MRPASDSGSRKTTRSRQVPPSTSAAPSTTTRSVRPSRSRRASSRSMSSPSARRQARLREAIRQVRAAAGPEAALRILAVDPDSRVPERRAVLTPFEI